MRDKIYILGGDYSPDEITDEVQVGEPFHSVFHDALKVEAKCIFAFMRPWRRDRQQRSIGI